MKYDKLLCGTKEYKAGDFSIRPGNIKCNPVRKHSNFPTGRNGINKLKLSISSCFCLSQFYMVLIGFIHLWKYF